MNFVNIKIESYCIANSMEVPDYLIALERETNLTQTMPQMLSGRLQGRILSMFSRLIKPDRILEIGTFTGYSALCLAEGLKTGGELITVEYDTSLRYIIEKYMTLSGLNDKINVVYDDAKKVLDTLTGMFDIVFLDAFKEDYIHYYEKVIPMLKSGGLIIADNVLWSGKVLEETKDSSAIAIKKFNKHVKNDERVENVIIPVRDGLSIIRKK